MRMRIATRLCLVTPSAIGPNFDNDLDAALSGGDVASLIIAPGERDPAALHAAAEKLAPIAKRHDVAALIVGLDAPMVDGFHVEGGVADLRAALARHRPQRIVGAGGIRSRDDAMTLGELEPDYLFFGRLDGDTAPALHQKSLELASWWSALFVIPAIIMGGWDLASAAEAAAAGIEFVALRRAVWDHEAGPKQAVAAANRLLAETVEIAR